MLSFIYYQKTFLHATPEHTCIMVQQIPFLFQSQEPYNFTVFFQIHK